MKLLRAVGMSFALYSRLPMPNLEWESESRGLVLYTFPLVGLAVGGGWILWLLLCETLELGQILQAAGMTILPLLVTGGIHMDGFCDVCDALASHQSRERKLEIMKDPHIGAFAALGCGLYLLADFGLWCETDPANVRLWTALLLLPVFSRALSAFGALVLPNARGGGLLNSVTGDARKPRISLLTAVLLSAGMIGLNITFCLPVLAGWLTLLWYLHTARREFGGTTGDLAGWFLQMCELACLAGLVLAQRLEAVL